MSDVPRDRSPEQRFLVIRLGSLGDIVHTIPAVAALRQGFPGARIDWVTQERWAPLVEMTEGVDHVIPLERSLGGTLSCIRELRGVRYGCAIDFQGLYKSAILPFFAGIPRRIGRDRESAREPGAARFYSDRVRPEGLHVAEMNLSLARRAGAPAGEMRFPLRVPEAALRAAEQKLMREGVANYVLVSPGGGWRSKCWPASRYGTLCEELWHRHGVRAVVNAGPGEELLAQELVGAAGEAKPLVVSPDLPELAALSAKARLVIAADTGPLHLAAALGAPVVALFDATSPERNGPLPRGHVVRASGRDGEHDDREQGDDVRGNYLRGDEYSAGMLAINVEQVLTAAQEEMSVRA